MFFQVRWEPCECFSKIGACLRHMLGCHNHLSTEVLVSKIFAEEESCVTFLFSNQQKRLSVSKVLSTTEGDLSCHELYQKNRSRTKAKCCGLLPVTTFSFHLAANDTSVSHFSFAPKCNSEVVNWRTKERNPMIAGTLIEVVVKSCDQI